MDYQTMYEFLTEGKEGLEGRVQFHRNLAVLMNVKSDDQDVYDAEFQELTT